jgi:hypothetical protein
MAEIERMGAHFRTVSGHFRTEVFHYIGKMRGKGRISANSSHFYIKILARAFYQNTRANMEKVGYFDTI